MSPSVIPGIDQIRKHLRRIAELAVVPREIKALSHRSILRRPPGRTIQSCPMTGRRAKAIAFKHPSNRCHHGTGLSSIRRGERLMRSEFFSAVRVNRFLPAENNGSRLRSRFSIDGNDFSIDGKVNVINGNDFYHDGKVNVIDDIAISIDGKPQCHQ
jgi:hypothetical protein